MPSSIFLPQACALIATLLLRWLFSGWWWWWRCGLWSGGSGGGCGGCLFFSWLCSSIELLLSSPGSGGDRISTSLFSCTLDLPVCPPPPLLSSSSFTAFIPTGICDRFSSLPVRFRMEPGMTFVMGTGSDKRSGKWVVKRLCCARVSSEYLSTSGNVCSHTRVSKTTNSPTPLPASYIYVYFRWQHERLRGGRCSRKSCWYLEKNRGPTEKHPRTPPNTAGGPRAPCGSKGAPLFTRGAYKIALSNSTRKETDKDVRLPYNAALSITNETKTCFFLPARWGKKLFFSVLHFLVKMTYSSSNWKQLCVGFRAHDSMQKSTFTARRNILHRPPAEVRRSHHPSSYCLNLLTFPFLLFFFCQAK